MGTPEEKKRGSFLPKNGISRKNQFCFSDTSKKRFLCFSSEINALLHHL
jgi:hypothetical protein